MEDTVKCQKEPRQLIGHFSFRRTAFSVKYAFDFALGNGIPLRDKEESEKNANFSKANLTLIGCCSQITKPT